MGDMEDELLEDIALSTKSRCLDVQDEEIKLEDLGSARKVIISKD